MPAEERRTAAMMEIRSFVQIEERRATGGKDAVIERRKACDREKTAS